MMMIGAIDNCDWWFFHMSHMKTVSEDFNVTLDFKGQIFTQSFLRPTDHGRSIRTPKNET